MKEKIYPELKKLSDRQLLELIAMIGITNLNIKDETILGLIKAFRGE